MGIQGNEIVDGWAELVVEKPDRHGAAAEQECPRDDCGCDSGATEMAEAGKGLIFGLPPAAFGLDRFRED